MTGDERRGALWISALAALLALCALAGDDAAKTVTREAVAAANAWSQYQAKATRRELYRISADGLALSLSAVEHFGARSLMARYRAEVQRYTREAEEIFILAKAHEAAGEVAARRDSFLDGAQALFQIAIVLATASLIASVTWLRVASETLAAGGCILALAALFGALL
jgi:hypothetical protein